MRSAVLAWARAECRRRRWALLALAALVGLSAGLVLTAAAGARRTSSAVDRFVEATRTGDLALDVESLDERSIEQLRSLPVVADSGMFSIVFAVVDGVEEDLGLGIPRDGSFGVDVEADRLIRGRYPHPRRVDEVALNEAAARAIGKDVGDKFAIRTLTPEQVAAESYFPPQGPTLDVRVVGVARGVADLADEAEGAILGTPAMAEVVEGRVDIFTSFLSLRAVDDVTPDELAAAVEAVVGNREIGFLPVELRTKPARDAVAALTGGLTVFALVGALTTAMLTGLAVGRQVATSSADAATLNALGLPATMRRLAFLSVAIPVAVGAGLLAAAVALIGSRWMPIGLARRADPDPGFDVDALVIVGGAATVALLVVVSAALSAWWFDRTARTPAVVSAATTAGAWLRRRVDPVVANGFRLALDRSVPRVPVRSAMVGITAAVVGVVAALAFASSLDRLVESPDRWGQPWDLVVNSTSEEIGQVAADLEADRRLSDLARWDAGFSFVQNEGMRAYGLRPLRGDIGFTLVSGRQPRHDDEVVLGPDAAERLGVSLGDRIEVSSPHGGRGTTVTVVGIGLFPEIDEGNFTESIGYVGDAFGRHAAARDAFEASQVVVRFGDDESAGAVTESIRQKYPNAISGESVPSPPAGVANLGRVRSVPTWLALFIAAVGIASTAHVIATTLRRRRGELATLRALGLTRTQAATCSVWQALTLTTAGLLLGVPLGLVIGRAAWSATAEPVGVATDLARPWVEVGLTVAGALVVAVVLAYPPAAIAARRSPSEALRTE